MLVELYSDTPTKQIARRLKRPVDHIYRKAHLLGLHKSDEFIRAHCRTGGPSCSPETTFKPGNRPQNWQPVGTEVVDSDGYRKRKIRDDAPVGMSRKNWRFVHVLLWEEHHGPVPAGHAIAFKDGDRANIVLENLECIPRAELARRNHHKHLPEDLRRAIFARAALQREITLRQERS